MRATLHRWKLATLCIGSLAALAACGDDSTGSGTDNDVLLFPDAVFDGFTPDTQQPTDTLTTTDTSDTQQPTDTRDATPPDLTPDVTPPQVVSTNPADGANNVALPLTITITFNEPLDPFKVAAETFKLLDVNGVGVPGTPTLSTDGLTVTWKPTTNDQSYATPYTIEVSGLVTDLAGNRIDNPLHFSFTTANYPNQDAYRDLAIKYAPTVKSSVELTGAGQPQVPTKLDADGDWNLANNKDWLVQQATSLVPAVYFTVAETRTHYFIHYMLYFPWVNRTGASEHANGTVVYMVTVEKARGATVERPVALHTWFREGTSEENFAFLTTESGIVRSGDDAKDWYAQAELAQDSLFPGGHFTAWVTATNHYACVWGQSVGNYCQWGSTVENGNTLVFAYTNGSPTPYAKENNAWPKTMSDIAGSPESLGYALIPALTSLWPRRFEKGVAAIFDATTLLGPYVPDAGRTVGAGLALPSKFLQPIASAGSSFGRPIWTIGYNPGTGMASDPPKERFAAGELGIDPAWYVWERHHSTVRDNSLVEFNESTGLGYSVDYCFNGVAGIDRRTVDLACQQ